MFDPAFYQGKKVFVTGHTGFKGTWLCKMLINAGARVTGYASEPPTQPNAFSICSIADQMESIIGDIRDLDTLLLSFCQVRPEIVFHLAAQPIVRDSYARPHLTYETNVMGTVNILECIRRNDCVHSFLNVTTDKVYQNRSGTQGYQESEPLDGFDPYSNSKSCSELITHSYQKSFFPDNRVAISTARAGNVIGGGDFASDRIIPDCVRAAIRGQAIVVRNPYSLRPYQHVLEPLDVYLMIAQKQYQNRKYTGYFNVGPDEDDYVSTGSLASLFCEIWGDGQTWLNQTDDGPHEAFCLKLDCSRLKRTFNWHPRWHIRQAVEKTIDWTRAFLENDDISRVMDRQILEFQKMGQLSEEKADV